MLALLINSVKKIIVYYQTQQTQQTKTSKTFTTRSRARMKLLMNFEHSFSQNMGVDLSGGDI
jgi:hypothetical protein